MFLTWCSFNFYLVEKDCSQRMDTAISLPSVLSTSYCLTFYFFQVAELKLAKFVEDIIVPPRMVDIIVDGEVIFLRDVFGGFCQVLVIFYS